MWDLQAYGILGYIVLIISIVLIRIVAVILVAGALATYIGLTGLMWWAAAIVIFFVINAIISGLRG